MPWGAGGVQHRSEGTLSGFLTWLRERERESEQAQVSQGNLVIVVKELYFLMKEFLSIYLGQESRKKLSLCLQGPHSQMEEADGYKTEWNADSFVCAENKGWTTWKEEDSF